MKNCQWCFDPFEPKVKYQIYCGASCREEATKEKMKERSRLEAVKKRAQEKRYCANGCGTVLNSWNSEKTCTRCRVDEKKVDKVLDQMKRLFDWEDLT